MAAPLTGFPYYAKTKDCLYAFIAKDKMFKVEMRGTNKNDGLAVDYYITRNMVIHHWQPYGHISAKQFEEYYRQLFESVLNKIIG